MYIKLIILFGLIFIFSGCGNIQTENIKNTEEVNSEKNIVKEKQIEKTQKEIIAEKVKQQKKYFNDFYEINNKNKEINVRVVIAEKKYKSNKLEIYAKSYYTSMKLRGETMREFYGDSIDEKVNIRIKEIIGVDLFNKFSS